MSDRHPASTEQARPGLGRPVARYRGPDRRGVLDSAGPGAGGRLAAGLVAGSIALPVLAAAAMARIHLASPVWSTALADLAFGIFLFTAAVLALCWRLTGEAAAASLAGIAVLASATVVPLLSRRGGIASPAALGIELAALALIGQLATRAVRGPEVRSDLRPIWSLSWMAAAVAIAGLVTGIGPIHAALSTHAVATEHLQVAAGSATALLGGWLVSRSVRRRRLLVVAGAATTLSIGCAGATAGATVPGGVFYELPLLLVVAAGLVLLSAGLGILQSTIHAVVRHDVRGRRRWEAAERELTAVQTTVKGDRHDIRNMLSAIDGTLVVLSGQRDRLPAVEVDRLLGALRSELRWLKAALDERDRGPDGGADADAGRFDLCELVSAVVAVRGIGEPAARCRLEPGLTVAGHPDRLALAIDNLLANAAVHAPGARVVVSTRLVHAPDGQPVAEIAVADDGPGLSDAELRDACGRGWRARASSGRPGSGLGLAQCAEWVGADGGSIELSATDPGRPEGHRGLTVTLRLPALVEGAPGASGAGADADAGAELVTPSRRASRDPGAPASVSVR